MKLKTCHTAFLAAVLFALLTPLASYSQESRGGLDENSSKDLAKQDQESPSGTESLENRTNLKSTNISTGTEGVFMRDAEIKKAVPKTAEKPQKDAEKAQKEEDPLSFNFLYYIIEKFKLSDIIE